MIVRVRFFATLRERVGAAQVNREVSAGSTVGDLWRELQRDYPGLAPLKMDLLCAVNRDYVGPGHVLQDRDEVVFVPPVSGG